MRKGSVEHASKPNGNSLATSAGSKLAFAIGNIRGRKKCAAPFVDAAKHRVRKARCRACLRTHELNALTHRNTPRSIEIEHLKRRDAQRHAHTSRNLRRLGNIAIKCLVKRAHSCGHAQGKRQSKCFVARIGQRSCRSRQDVADKAPTILGCHKRTQRAAARRGKLGHESFPQVRPSPCRPAAQALASI